MKKPNFNKQLKSSYRCTYKCHWPNCGAEFERIVGSGFGDGEHKVSSQVPCFKCGNNLRTWKDAITKEEITE